jgi:hypothetical protein
MKTYIVRATAQIQLTAETDKPEDMKSLVESVLMDVCDVSADITNLSIEEISGGKSNEF